MSWLENAKKWFGLDEAVTKMEQDQLREERQDPIPVAEIDRFKEWRKPGERFVYLGVEMMVSGIGYMDVDEDGISVVVPNLVADYVDKNGNLQTWEFRPGEFDVLFEQNLTPALRCESENERTVQELKMFMALAEKDLKERKEGESRLNRFCPDKDPDRYRDLVRNEEKQNELFKETGFDDDGCFVRVPLDGSSLKPKSCAKDEEKDSSVVEEKPGEAKSDEVKEKLVVVDSPRPDDRPKEPSDV